MTTEANETFFTTPVDEKEWTDLGGDLEASFDGAHYVDIRVKGSKTTRLFISKPALQKAMDLFPPEVVGGGARQESSP